MSTLATLSKPANGPITESVCRGATIVARGELRAREGVKGLQILRCAADHILGDLDGSLEIPLAHQQSAQVDAGAHPLLGNGHSPSPASRPPRRRTTGLLFQLGQFDHRDPVVRAGLEHFGQPSRAAASLPSAMSSRARLRRAADSSGLSARAAFVGGTASGPVARRHAHDALHVDRVDVSGLAPHDRVDHLERLFRLVAPQVQRRQHDAGVRLAGVLGERLLQLIESEVRLPASNQADAEIGAKVRGAAGNLDRPFEESWLPRRTAFAPCSPRPAATTAADHWVPPPAADRARRARASHRRGRGRCSPAACSAPAASDSASRRLRDTGRPSRCSPVRSATCRQAATAARYRLSTSFGTGSSIATTSSSLCAHGVGVVPRLAATARRYAARGSLAATC